MSIQSITDVRAETPTITLSPSDLLLLDQTLKTVAATLAELKAFVRPSAATTSEDGLFTSTEKTKLAAIAAQATKNQTDAHLLNRANHSGTQPIASVTGLQDALDSKIDSTTGVDIEVVTGLQDALDAIDDSLTTITSAVSAAQGEIDGLETTVAAKLPAANPAPTGVFRIPPYTLATLPSTTGFENYLIFVSDATAGGSICYADGSDWKIVGTDTVVS